MLPCSASCRDLKAFWPLLGRSWRQRLLLKRCEHDFELIFDPSGPQNRCSRVVESMIFIKASFPRAISILGPKSTESSHGAELPWRSLGTLLELPGAPQEPCGASVRVPNAFGAPSVRHLSLWRASGVDVGQILDRFGYGFVQISTQF